jgi:hypothetical protein
VFVGVGVDVSVFVTEGLTELVGVFVCEGLIVFVGVGVDV